MFGQIGSHYSSRAMKPFLIKAACLSAGWHLQALLLRGRRSCCSACIWLRQAPAMQARRCTPSRCLIPIASHRHGWCIHQHNARVWLKLVSHLLERQGLGTLGSSDISFTLPVVGGRSKSPFTYLRMSGMDQQNVRFGPANLVVRCQLGTTMQLCP